MSLIEKIEFILFKKIKFNPNKQTFTNAKMKDLCDNNNTLECYYYGRISNYIFNLFPFVILCTVLYIFITSVDIKSEFPMVQIITNVVQIFAFMLAAYTFYAKFNQDMTSYIISSSPIISSYLEFDRESGDIELFIENNSEYPAYDVKITFSDNSIVPQFKKEISKNKRPTSMVQTSISIMPKGYKKKWQWFHKPSSHHDPHYNAVVFKSYIYIRCVSQIGKVVYFRYYLDSSEIVDRWVVRSKI